MLTDYYAPGSLSVEFHDLLAEHDANLPGDIEFYDSVAGNSDGRTLDLGCGCGRVTIGLANRGRRVTGVDLSPAMLAHAKERRKKLPVTRATRVRLVHGDMRTFELRQTFTTVIVPFYGLNHFDITGRAAVLARTAAHLAPGGRAAFHVLPTWRFTPLTQEQVSAPLVVPCGAGRTLTVRAIAREIDARRHRMTSVIEYALAANERLIRKSHERLVQHSFLDEEIRELGAAAGLKLLSDTTRFREGGLPQKVYVFARDT